MKKIVSLSTLLLACSYSWADHWTPASIYDYPTESPVYVSLKINGGVATADSIVELAAFIDGQCRATAKTPVANGKYSLRVVGNDDDINKTIEYKVYHKGLEYGLQPVSDSKFTKETAMVNLDLSAITGIRTTTPLCVTADLPRQETLTYTYIYKNAKGKDITPSNRSSVLSTLSFSWNTYGASNFTVSGDKLNIIGECAEMPLKCTVTGPKYGSEQFKKECSTELTASYPVSFNFPASLNLTRFTSASISLPNLIGSIFDPSLVEFQFPEINGVPMVRVSYERKNDKWYFNLWANIVGQATYKVLYDGVVFMSTDNKETGTVTVDDTYYLPEGWSWLSLYATDDVTNSIRLIGNDGKYTDWAKTNIADVRSQFGLLYNDPSYGLFGDITDFNVNDGMYKVKTNGETQFSSGHKTSNGYAVTKQIRKGYNWFNNPYQLDLTARQLTKALGFTPAKGDKVIGKNGFTEYDGTKWQASTSFLFEAGKGYMYYSTRSSNVTMHFDDNITYTCNSMVNSLASSPISFARLRVAKDIDNVSSPWTYDATRFADNMAIVASLDGIDNPENYSIGAFVGDECRGEGSASESGNMFVNVAGKSGENVKFKLYNKQTGELTDLNESLKYSNMAGSLSNPVHLTSDEVTTGVSFANTKGTDTIEIHDITGRKVNSMTHGVYVVKYNNGVRKIKK